MQNCTQTKQLCSKKVGWLVDSGKQKFQKDKQRGKSENEMAMHCAFAVCIQQTNNIQILIQSQF